MKKSFKVKVLAVASLLTLSGISSFIPSVSAEEFKVEVIAKGFQHDFWKAVNKGADEAAKEFGAKINFVGPQNETAIAEQLEQINNAINKGPSAIALAALDTEAAVDALNVAKDKGIPIIGFDSGVPGAPEGSIFATASTDNYAAGANAAEHMLPLIQEKVGKDKVRIGVVSQEANSQSITQRTAGFIEKMVELLEGKDLKVAVLGHDKFKNDVAENDANVVIEVRIPAQVDDAAAKTEASTVLEKADTIAIYGSNEFAAKAIINANEGFSESKLGADKIIAVGFDSGALQQDAIRSGVFAGSITQDPVQIGYQAVKLAVQAAKGESVSDVDTGSKWYDASNIDDEDIQAVLYQ
ncbi:ABC transporter substrate-binding protein [Aerococcaceae bacterium zg-ZJ1578]|uniref:ABC transporter substrate-binding protein n=1 Tax=Aerococcaceae TaxID=186827 RepID=UPI0013BD020D|nr:MULTISPECIES: ABC transporter substrate-binding protein [unclassified Facklamia]MBK0347624.1 ABC transporter substrate-binding protein [Aerococcaceae bacterium zg-1578]MBR7927374.1 ABC transporter substrate-binding protein [Aerococcaceae bacterium zg-ZUI334]QQD65810.1 ABC transporter substrate-binding protein [Aerococcaceae bacterium zg-252]NEW64104.1 substrate-binding domain-containing protein [Facklamia sp. 252]NEW67562.1 substrate-binding domain-containing protein [Facklamia sp. 253]